MSNNHPAVIAFLAIAKSLPARLVVTLILIPAGPIGWLIAASFWIVGMVG